MKHILPIKDYTIYSNRRKSRWKNDGFRSLYESVVPKEVLMTLDDWKENDGSKCVLIGGLALSYYEKPRYTEDMDLIFLTEEDIPDKVNKFKKYRQHGFEHIKTGVTVELITPSLINKNKSFFEEVFNNAILSDGIKVASPESLIASKLSKRDSDSKSNSDKSDIINLYNYCYENDIEINLSKYTLGEKELKRYDDIISNIDDNIYENKQSLELKNYSKKIKKTIDFHDYKIHIIEDNFTEPGFIFTKDISKIGNKFIDFVFYISLTKPFNENGRIRVILSSTGYPSFTKFKKEEEILSDWLNKNINFLKDEWNKVNDRKI